VLNVPACVGSADVVEAIGKGVQGIPGFATGHGLPVAGGND